MANPTIEYDILINSAAAKQSLTELFAALQRLARAQPGPPPGVNDADIRRGTRAVNDQATAIGRLQQGLSRFAQFTAGYLGFRALVNQLGQVGDAIIAQEAAMSRLTFANAGDTAAAARDFAFLAAEADRLGQPLAILADSFGRLSVAALGSKLEGEGVRRVFSGIAEAAMTMRLGPEELKGTIYALTQMMSKGIVLSEEFKLQLSERLPAALTAATRATKLTKMEFMKLLESGQLNTESFLPAFVAELRKMAEEQLPAATKSFLAERNRLETAVLLARQTIGQGGLGDAMIDSIRRTTEAMRSPELREGLALLSLGFAKAQEYAVRFFAFMSKGTRIVGAYAAATAALMQAKFEEIGNQGEAVADVFVAGFKTIVPRISAIFNTVIANIKTATAGMLETLANTASFVGAKGTANSLGDTAGGLRAGAWENDDAASAAREEVAGLLAAAKARAEQLRRESKDAMRRGEMLKNQILENLAVDLQEKPTPELAPPPPLPTEAPWDDPRSPTADKGGKAAANRLKSAMEAYYRSVREYADKLAKAEADKANAALERDFAARLLTQTDYLDKKAALELDEIARQAAANNQRITELQAIIADEKTAQDERVQAAADIVKIRGDLEALDGQQAVVRIKLEADKAEVSRYLAELRDDINASLMEMAGNSAQAAHARLGAEVAKLLSDPRIQGSPELQALIREQEAARARIIDIEEASRQAGFAVSELSLAESAVQRKVEAGTINELDAQKQIREARLATAAAMLQQVEAAERLAALSRDPEQILAAKQLRDQYESLAATSNAAAVSLNESFFGSLRENLRGLGTDVKSIGELFRNVVRDSIAALAEMYLTRWTGNLAAAMGGAGGGLGGFIAGLAGFSEGGKVSGPGTGTSDSILARLSAGEFVLRAASVKALGLGALNYINRHGALPRFAAGGLVGEVGAGLGGPTTVNANISPNVVIGTGQLVDALRAEPQAERLFCDIFIKNKTRLLGR